MLRRCKTKNQNLIYSILGNGFIIGRERLSVRNRLRTFKIFSTYYLTHANDSYGRWEGISFYHYNTKEDVSSRVSYLKFISNAVETCPIRLV